MHAPRGEPSPLVPEDDLPDVGVEQLHELAVHALEDEAGVVGHDVGARVAGEEVEDVLLPLDCAVVGAAAAVTLEGGAAAVAHRVD